MKKLKLSAETMSINKTMAKRHTSELSKLEQYILKNVASRKWNKEQLHAELGKVYCMGIKHSQQLMAMITAAEQAKWLEVETNNNNK
tara:strand:- start:4879 stop:5139 length:261 start_codon:yes stop_codon:yes gene_type:complete